MEILINILIVILLYVVPLIVFVKTVKWRKYSKSINIIIIIVYLGLIFIVPSMQSNVLPFAIVLIIMYRMKGNFRGDNDYFTYGFSIREFKLSSGFRYALVGYGMVFLVSLITQVLLMALGIEFKTQEVIDSLASYDIVKFLIATPSVIIFAPIVEEYVFRYILFEKIFRKVLKGNIGFILSALLVSLIFATVHNNLAALGMLFVISFYNCYLIEKKGYWYAVFNHFFVNMLTTTFLFVSKLI
ncbi:CPBP family intramembrane glutamic endopeptidase [Clostridium tunisiense]|uniref:CPBP family intramembrane glutamic endopeptidase n=1 Tax=Clostridium tunisiense TaxID=219748 RepID=UPI00031FBCCE|nr:CPBP family intramembrane glutamic endopeptidase [Clostridium tunisiense]